ncbi:MAG: potassium/proton antiporter [Lentisphaeria bacterium]
MLSSFVFLLGLFILGCVCSSRLSSRFNMPCLLLFLGVGMLMRHMPDFGNFSLQRAITDVSGGLSWQVANFIGMLALAFILFSGGYDTSWKSLQKVKNRGVLLATVGVLLTAFLVGIFSYCVFNLVFPFPVRFSWCLLFGSIISSTDAAAVFSIFRGKSIGLKHNIKDILELESGSNDPMATFLTVFMLEIVAQEVASGTAVSCSRYLLIVPLFCVKMVVGVAIGLLTAKLAMWLYHKINLEYDSLYYVLTFAWILLTYGLSSVCYGNGFIAVYVAGVYLGNHDFIFHNSNGRFCDAIAWLMQVFLFGMLGFMCKPELIWEYKGTGILLAFFLMLVARPAACILCLLKSKYSRNARMFISWVGLRGGAPIMLATFPMMLSMNIPAIVQGKSVLCSPNEILFNIVFFIVVLSVVIQGSTLTPVARLLKLDKPYRAVLTPPIRFENTTYTSPKYSSSNSAVRSDSAIQFYGTKTEEMMISKKSDLDQKKLLDVKLPHAAFILMIRRDDYYIVPRGNTVIHAGDIFTVLGTPSVLEETLVFLHSHEPVSSELGLLSDPC